MSITPGSILSAAHLDSTSIPAVKRIVPLFISLFTLLACVKSVLAQEDIFTDSNRSQRPFWVNVLFFHTNETEMTLTEVFVEIPYASLTFVRTAEGYETNAEVGAIIEDASGFQISGDAISDAIRADDFEATRSRSQTHLFYLPFRIEPGKYTLRVVVEDEHTGSRFANACKIEVPSFHSSQLQLSSLQLARHLGFSTSDSPLSKNGRLVIPNVPHVFSSDKPSCFLYFEAYNLTPMSSPTDSFQVQCQISRLGKQVRLVRWNIPCAETKVAVSLPLNFKDLVPGDYLLTVTIVDQDGKRESKAVAQFYIVRPSIVL